MEQECAGLHEKVQYLTAQNKGLQAQLSETKRKHAESECKVRSWLLLLSPARSYMVQLLL